MEKKSVHLTYYLSDTNIIIILFEILVLYISVDISLVPRQFIFSVLQITLHKKYSRHQQDK